jgi:hypothetical protein
MQQLAFCFVTGPRSGARLSRTLLVSKPVEGFELKTTGGTGR